MYRRSFTNEFFFTKNEKLNFNGEVTGTHYTLNSCDFGKSELNITFNSLEELLNIPFQEPDKFYDFLSKHWVAEDLKCFLEEKEYSIEGLSYKLDGIKS